MYGTGKKKILKTSSHGHDWISFRFSLLPCSNRSGSISTQKLFQCVTYQFSSATQSCPALCDPMDCSTPGFPVQTNSRSLLKLMSIKSVIPSSHLILYRPLFLLPSIFPSIRVLSNESVLRIRWPKYWSFSFNLSPSTSVLPMNTQDWSPLGLTGWISLQSKGLSRVY